jgi:hypothetical protein
MSLISGESEKRIKMFEKVKHFGPLVSILSYISGLVYFLLLPHNSLVHKTYMSENALSPGDSLTFKPFENFFKY